MDQTTQILALVFVAALGIAAVVAILRRDRVTAEEATERPLRRGHGGDERCPSCGMGNLVTDSTCASCGKRLPG